MRKIAMLIMILWCSIIYSEVKFTNLPKKFNNSRMINQNDIKNEYSISFYKKYNPFFISKGDLDYDNRVEYVVAFRDNRVANKWYIVILRKDGELYRYIQDFQFTINNIKYCIISNNKKSYIYVSEAESGALWNIEFINGKYIVKNVGY